MSALLSLNVKLTCVVMITLLILALLTLFCSRLEKALVSLVAACVCLCL